MNATFKTFVAYNVDTSRYTVRVVLGTSTTCNCVVIRVNWGTGWQDRLT